MQSSKSKHSLDLQNVIITDEKPKESRKKKSKYSIYQIVRMKIFFVKNKKSSKSKSSKLSKLAKVTTEHQQFVFTVTDFDEEQLIKAKAYIKSLKYSEALSALSILEPITQKKLIKSDYDILFLIGQCHEHLQNYHSADRYYRTCADYLYDNGYWEANYGTFILKRSDLNLDERVEKGINRLLSAANKKRYISAMYILGKVYINGLYDVNQDFSKGEFYLKRAYNGGESERSWSVYEKKAKELVESGQLSKVPDKNVWAREQ